MNPPPPPTATSRTTSINFSHFSYEFSGTLKSFISLISVKPIKAKLNLRHNDKFEIKISKIAVAHVPRKTQYLVISHCCVADSGREL